MITDMKGLIKELPFLKAQTVYKKVREKNFPHIDYEGRYYFDTEKVISHIKGYEVPTNSEIKSQSLSEAYSRKKKP